MIYNNQMKPLDILYEWTPEKMVEVLLETPDDFLTVKETLSRIGILSKRPDTTGKHVLTQSCHILHKRGKYYIMHFKELFCLDGKESDLTISDVERRNLITGLLVEWGLVKLVNSNLITKKSPMSSIRVIPYKEKNNFVLRAKYQIGKK